MFERQGHATQPTCAPHDTADNTHSFNIRQVIEEFCGRYEQALDARRLYLSTRISSNLPVFFYGTPELISNLLDDLASYSLSHISEGCVVLDVKAEPLRDGRYSIYFTITISGLGIPLAKEMDLFNPFTVKLTKDDTPNPAPNLYHARKIARMLDGDVSVQNSVGFGTRYMAEIILTCLPER